MLGVSALEGLLHYLVQHLFKNVKTEVQRDWLEWCHVASVVRLGSLYDTTSTLWQRSVKKKMALCVCLWTGRVLILLPLSCPFTW